MEKMCGEGAKGYMDKEAGEGRRNEGWKQVEIEGVRKK